MRFVIEKALRFEQLHYKNPRPKIELAQKLGFEGLVGRSPKMEAIVQMVYRMAASDSTVLILGESGNGKELLAREIHVNSGRRGCPFVMANCPSIPE